MGRWDARLYRLLGVFPVCLCAGGFDAGGLGLWVRCRCQACV